MQVVTRESCQNEDYYIILASRHHPLVAYKSGGVNCKSKNYSQNRFHKLNQMHRRF